MSKLIEELRAQRTLIQKHLEWLDAQVQQAEKNHADSHSADSVKQIPTQPVLGDLKNQTRKKEATPANSALETDIPIEVNFTQSTSATDIKRLQIGCFILFTAATLVFLFLLFGLPYLLD